MKNLNSQNLGEDKGWIHLSNANNFQLCHLKSLATGYDNHADANQLIPINKAQCNCLTNWRHVLV